MTRFATNDIIMLQFQQKERKSMQNHIDLIAKAPFFNGVKIEDFTRTLDYLNAQISRFQKDEPIFTEGEAVTRAGIILSGQAQIRIVDYNGNSNILAQLPSGEMFGEALCSIEADELPVSIFASEPCEVLFFDSKKLMDIEKNDFDLKPLLVKNLLLIVSAKALRLRAKINILSQRTTREKIMAYLLMESKSCGKKEFTIKLDRQQLADFLGVERSAMSAELSRLKKDGIIETRKSYFKILTDY